MWLCKYSIKYFLLNIRIFRKIAITLLLNYHFIQLLLIKSQNSKKKAYLFCKLKTRFKYLINGSVWYSNKLNLTLSSVRCRLEVSKALNSIRNTIKARNSNDRYLDHFNRVVSNHKILGYTQARIVIW